METRGQDNLSTGANGRTGVGFDDEIVIADRICELAKEDGSCGDCSCKLRRVPITSAVARHRAYRIARTHRKFDLTERRDSVLSIDVVGSVAVHVLYRPVTDKKTARRKIITGRPALDEVGDGHLEVDMRPRGIADIALNAQSSAGCDALV